MESQLFLLCTCPICYLPYDNKERVPRFVTCTQGHTICSKCICIQVSIQDPFQCPFDKQLVIMLDNDISRFPINRTLLHIVEEGHSNCLVHIDKKLDLVCRGCKEQICDRCERKGAHQGHNVIVIEDALEEAKQKMNGIKQLVDRIQEVINDSQAEINVREQALMQEVDEKFKECINLLLRKRDETQSMIREHFLKFKEAATAVKLDPALNRIASWSEAIEREEDIMKDSAVQPLFYDILDENIETLTINVDTSIAKEKENIKNVIVDLEKIKVSLAPEFERVFNSLFEVENIPKDDEIKESTNINFKWKTNWEKIDILKEIKKAEESHFESFAEKMIGIYKFRLEAVQHLSQAGSPSSLKMPPFYLCSFSCFLGSDSRCSKLLKWYILDSTLQNSEMKVKLDELKINENFFAILEEKINMLPDNLKFQGLILKKDEKALLGQKIKDYTSKSLLITYLNFLLDSYMKDRWIDACYAVNQILKIDEQRDSYIDKVLKDATRVNCLRLALIIEQVISSQDMCEAIELINYLQGLVKGVLDKDELHTSQIQLILDEAIEAVPKECDKLEKLKERVNKFKAAEHAPNELSKALQCYSPVKKAQIQVEGFSDEEVYYWKEKGENSAYRMKQLANEMLQCLEPYVDFHNCLNTFKQAIKFEERQKLGYLYKEKQEKEPKDQIENNYAQ